VRSASFGIFQRPSSAAGAATISRSTPAGAVRFADRRPTFCDTEAAQRLRGANHRPRIAAPTFPRITAHTRGGAWSKFIEPSEQVVIAKLERWRDRVTLDQDHIAGADLASLKPLARLSRRNGAASTRPSKTVSNNDALTRLPGFHGVNVAPLGSYCNEATAAAPFHGLPL